jgi:hypothetical protein
MILDYMSDNEFDRRLNEAKIYTDRLIETAEYLAGPTKADVRRRAFQDRIGAAMGLAGLFEGAHERLRVSEAERKEAVLLLRNAVLLLDMYLASKVIQDFGLMNETLIAARPLIANLEAHLTDGEAASVADHLRGHSRRDG